MASFPDVLCSAFDIVGSNLTAPQPLQYPCVLPVSMFYHCPTSDTAESCIKYAQDKNSQNAFPAESFNENYDFATNNGGIKQWILTTGYVLRILVPTLIVLSVVGHILVSSVIMQRHMRGSCNSFQISAAISAIIYAISLLLLRLGDYIASYDEFVLYKEGKEYIHHIHFASFLIWAWSLISAGIERIRAGSHTDDASPGCASWAADLLTVFVWCAAAGVTFANFWYSYLARWINGIEPDTNLACPILFWVHMCLSVFLPFIIAIVTIGFVVRALRRQLQSIGKITLGTSGDIWRQRLADEIQWTKLVLVQLILFVILVGPYCWTQFVRILQLANSPAGEVCFWQTLIDIMQLGVLFFQALQFVLFGCVLERFAYTFRSLCCGCLCPPAHEPLLGNSY